MERVSVHEAKTHLSRLLRKVGEGQEIVITSRGKPVARLAPPPIRKKRILGDMEGRKIHLPADFDEPMPDEWFETDEYPQG